MAQSSTPRILIFKADGAITKGDAVKGGSDDLHVAVCSATSDKAIGIAQNATTVAGDLCEVAIPGGGAKALVSGTVAFGDLLAPQSDGSLNVAATGNRVIAMAMAAGVSGDLIACEVEASKLP